MQRQSIISLWCERVIETGWLLALSLIPIYFNLLSARHFEPDKATTLRALVLIMAAAGLIRALEHLTRSGPPRPERPAAADEGDMRAGGNPLAGIWRSLTQIPLAVPVLVYALVFVVTTLTSVVPLTSFWGSYQRLQGTYTNLSYIGLFVIIVATLRRRAQLDRIIMVTLMTGLAVAAYGVLQHFSLDPLPWRGDVITRVASTMGNSIFVAAYLIMVVPLGLYWLFRSLAAAATPSERPNRGADGLWALAYTILVGGTLAFLLASLKFVAVVQVPDFRYWWVFPGAVIVSTALWFLLTLDLQHRAQRLPLWPGVLFVLYLLWLGLTFGTSLDVQAINTNNARGTDWPLWLLGGSMAIVLFYGMALVLPRQADQPASRLEWWLRTAGALGVTLVLLIAIVFSQSRGPWIGLGAGLFVFFLLVLLQAVRRAYEHGRTTLAQRLRIGLWVWLGVTLLAGVFLIIFNLSDAPFFQRLRDVPYVGRMGQLLEVDTGTGLVRRLIWVGDEHAGGAVDLVTSNPVRTIIGWGPESMFVAFNPFYPPLLTSVEARGASPDRSHQAILDELVTRGVLGLASYLFVLISFGVLCWRLLRKSREWHWQLFFIACLSIVVSHFVEGLTGIPIVSTLMMLWVVLAMTVTGGVLAGHYTLGVAAEQPVVSEAVPADTRGASGDARRSRSKKGRGSGASARRSQPVSRRATPVNRLNPAALAFYGLVLGLTLMLAWWFNINPVYADMRFQQGQSYTGQPGSGLNGQILGMSSYLAAIRNNPREDFYYLNLGRSLMNIANERFVQGVPLGDVEPQVALDDLLAMRNVQEVAAFVQSSSPLELLSYAEAVLERARTLNDLNKDHYANLGRLNNFWYNWTQEPARLQRAADWFEQASEIAPQDVTLLNERAGVTALLGTYAEAQGDMAAAQDYYAQAEQMLQRSRELDDRYEDTEVRLADLYRLQGDLERATDRYVEIIEQNPHQLDGSIQRIIEAMQDNPEALRRLHDAYAASAGDDALLHNIAGLLAVRARDMEQAVESYAQAVEIQPANLEYRRNYTIVLSDTRQYSQALDEAQATLALAQDQNAPEAEVSQLQNLVAFLQQQAAGGQ